MLHPLEKIILTSYCQLYWWRFLFKNLSPTVRSHYRLLQQLSQMKLSPAQTIIANTVALHLAMSAKMRVPFVSPSKNTKSACNELFEIAQELLDETLAASVDKLSAESVALLYLTGFWILQRSDTHGRVGGAIEEQAIQRRKKKLAQCRALVNERLDDLNEERRVMARAMLSAGDRDGAEVHQELRRTAEKWWIEGRSDELIFTLRDQINLTFLTSPCYYLFDTTLRSLLKDLPDTLPDISKLIDLGQAKRRQKNTYLVNRYFECYPDRSKGQLMKYSIEHRGWRVHALSASRDLGLIDDIIEAKIPDKTKAHLLYQFDDFRSLGTAHAKFRSLLSRNGIKLRVPVTLKERKAILKQEQDWARLRQRKAA